LTERRLKETQQRNWRPQRACDLMMLSNLGPPSLLPARIERDHSPSPPIHASMLRSMVNSAVGADESIWSIFFAKEGATSIGGANRFSLTRSRPSGTEDPTRLIHLSEDAYFECSGHNSSQRDRFVESLRAMTCRLFSLVLKRWNDAAGFALHQMP